MAIKYMDLITRMDIGGKSIQHLLGLLCSKNAKEYSSCARWVQKLMNEEISHLPSNSMEVEDMEDKSVEDMITEQDEKAKKKRLAEERRQKMMAQMNSMQKAFMRKHSNVFSDTEEEMSETPISEEISWYLSNHLTVIGPDTSSPEANDIIVVCMLCQEEESIEIHTNPFVVTCFLQKSNLLMNRQSLTENGDSKVEPILNNISSLNISSCGHVIHHKCWDKYYSSVKEREIGDFFHRRQRTCIDVKAHEYLCPLCNSLCNTVLPLLPRLQDTQSSSVKEQLGLAEFLAYLERFSVEIMPRNISRKVSSKGTHRATHQDSSSSIAGTIRRFIESFSSERVTSSENFMELLPKRLMKLSGLSDENVLHAIPLTWMATSFTFQAIECRCRESADNIFADISDRHNMFLRSLVQYLSSSCLITYLDPIETYCRTLLDFFLNMSKERDNSLNILDADIFGMFISLHYIVSILQNIFQEKTPGFKTIPQCLIDDVIVKLCIRTFIVRISVICPVFYGEDTANTSVVDETVLSTWQHIRGLLKMDVPKASSINQSLLKDYFTRSLLVFLRCTALFLHYHTGIRLPDGLKQDVIDGEIKQLLKYLNLPDSVDEILSLEWVLGEPQMETMVKRWCQNKKLLDDMYKRDTPICIPFVQWRRLYRLPENYSTLISMASQFKCPTGNDKSRFPSLCLICGSLLCSKCFYCQTENEHYGACSKHIMTCGNGVGIFLPIRHCEVVLLFNQSKGAYMSSPYLDAYGEPDRGFKRGNPLFLNKKRYNYLEQLWLQHNIPQTIAQLTESNRNMLAYEWNAF